MRKFSSNLVNQRIGLMEVEFIIYYSLLSYWGALCCFVMLAIADMFKFHAETESALELVNSVMLL